MPLGRHQMSGARCVLRQRLAIRFKFFSCNPQGKVQLMANLLQQSLRSGISGDSRHSLLCLLLCLLQMREIAKPPLPVIFAERLLGALHKDRSQSVARVVGVSVSVVAHQIVTPAGNGVRALRAQILGQLGVRRGDKHQLHAGFECRKRAAFLPRSGQYGSLQHTLFGGFRRREAGCLIELQIARHNANRRRAAGRQ